MLLDAWGIVVVKHGVGTFVAELPQDALSVPFRVSAERSPQMYRHLHQVRQALEPMMAYVAATCAQPEHIEEMKEAVRTMEQAPVASEEYVQADVAFHTTLAKSTGNPLFPIVIYPTVDLMRDLWSLPTQTQKGAETGLPWHRQMVEHIKNKNAEKARETMEILLDAASQEMERAILKPLEEATEE